MDCLFCKIIAREIPATILYEDERIIILQDIKGARSIGMHAVLVNRSSATSLATYDIPVVRTLTDLPNLLS